MPELSVFKECHAGRRCFIVGNGPSLTRMELPSLRDEVTFGMNCIFLGFERFGFRPTYYTVEDVFVAEDNSREINALDGMVKFLPLDLSYCLEDGPNVAWVNFVRRYEPYPLFSEDAAQQVYWGSTVTFLAMQLAFYMGCDPIYLIGVDFDYKVPDYALGQEEITSREDDVNHFHPAYFGKGKRWHNPRLDRVEPSYREACRFFDEKGRRLLNATAGGKLEIFPRVEYETVLKNS
jgi:hypothetical protein